VWLLTGLVVLWAAVATSSASAAVTLGQVPATTPPAACSTQRDTAQQTVSSGNSYVFPATDGIVSWTVTSWSTFASSDPGQSFALKVFRQNAGMNYAVVGHDGPHDLTSGVLNRFTASVTAKPGDVLGLNSGPNPADDACNFIPAPGMDAALLRQGDLADGQSGDFGTSTPTGWHVNITATATPTSQFSFGALTRNRRKGTATLAVNLPNPGEFVLSGKGLRSASGARAAVVASGPGTVSVLIKAKGKKLSKLNQTGKAKVKVRFTFTPTGGDPRTESRKLKLKKT
jgi:hypothetical protein